MTLRAWLPAMAIAVLASGAAAQSGSEPPARTVAPALAWLGVMDEARYGDAWDAASSVFKQGVPRETWITQAKTGRGSLGAVTSRKAGQGTAQRSPPGAPPGEYAIIEFDTAFAMSSPARKELVSLFLEADGTWRVAGYFIR